MKKFCSKCGAPLKPDDQFCSICGTPVDGNSKHELEKINSIKQRPQVKRSEIRNSKRNFKTRNIIIGVVIAIVVLVAGGWAIYQHGRSSAESKIIGGNGRLTTAEIKKMPNKQLAAWAILYADKKYGKKWGEAADELRSGHLTIKSYSSHKFGDYEISATNGSTLYAVNNQVGYLISKDKKEITYVGNKSNYSNRDVLEQIYPVVKSENTEENVSNWNNNLTIVKGKDRTASSSTKKFTTEEKKDTKATKLWSDEQRDRLISYMDEFGDKMHQPYSHYTGSGSITTAAGQEYPSFLSEGKFKLSSGEKDSRDPEDMDSINLKWNPDVTDKDNDSNTYNVVAIFNYNGKSAEQHITYLFCFYHGEPVALVDQTTNGEYTVVHATANHDLTSNFEEIANND